MLFLAAWVPWFHLHSAAAPLMQILITRLPCLQVVEPESANSMWTPAHTSTLQVYKPSSQLLHMYCQPEALLGAPAGVTSLLLTSTP